MEGTVQKPRTIDSISSTFTVEDIFKLIESKYTKFKTTFYIFKIVLDTYLTIVRRHLLEGNQVEMPASLGRLVIFKKKTGCEYDDSDNIIKRTYYIDVAKTREFKGKKIYKLNIEHIIKMRWYKGNFKNKFMFYFKPTTFIRKHMYDVAANNKIEITQYRDG